MGFVLVWLREFLTALLADIVVHTDAGKGIGGGLKGMVMGKAGAELKDHFFGLGEDDEAGFLQAVEALPKALQEVLIRRMAVLGDPQDRDNSVRRRFRRVLISYSDLETRAKVLRGLAELPEDRWQQLLVITGAAEAGSLDKAIAGIKQFFNIDLGSIVSAADQSAAAKVASATSGLRSLIDRVKSTL